MYLGARPLCAAGGGGVWFTKISYIETVNVYEVFGIVYLNMNFENPNVIFGL